MTKFLILWQFSITSFFVLFINPQIFSDFFISKARLKKKSFFLQNAFDCANYEKNGFQIKNGKFLCRERKLPNRGKEISMHDVGNFRVVIVGSVLVCFLIAICTRATEHLSTLLSLKKMLISSTLCS